MQRPTPSMTDAAPLPQIESAGPSRCGWLHPGAAAADRLRAPGDRPIRRRRLGGGGVPGLAGGRRRQPAGRRMPYAVSSPESETDALRVVAALGCRSERVDITPMVDPMLAIIGCRAAQLRVRGGNVMARQRMIVLYDRSVGIRCARRRNVEQDRGAARLRDAPWRHGCCPGADRRPVQDPAASRGAGTLGVPAEIVAKPPSADLWPGQTDEAELGATYADLDRILFALVDRRWSVERCMAAGLDRGAGRVGRAAGGPHGVQAPDAAGRQALAANAGDRPPLPAPPPGLASGAIARARPRGCWWSARRSATSATSRSRAAEALRSADLVVAEDTRVRGAPAVAPGHARGRPCRSMTTTRRSGSWSCWRGSRPV